MSDAAKLSYDKVAKTVKELAQEVKIADADWKTKKLWKGIFQVNWDKDETRQPENSAASIDWSIQQEVRDFDPLEDYPSGQVINVRTKRQ